MLKREVAHVVGGEEYISFDILNGTMSVHPGAGEVSADAVKQAVARTGMSAEVLWGNAQFSDKGQFLRRRGKTVLTAASGVFGLAGFFVHVLLDGGGVQTALGTEGMAVALEVPVAARGLYGLGIVFGAWYVVPKAWYAARRLRPDINLLMTLAVLGAAAIGEWFEAAVVSFLFAASLTLESWSVSRARRAIATLMDLAPPTARLRREDGSEEQVPPDQVPVGAMFVVIPGEKMPLDGRVVQGVSDVNQAPITGESVSVPKQPGDSVFAGTINGDGALEVECTKPAQDTTLAHIVRMVGEAQARRAPVEQWIEKFARIYTPFVMGLALTVLLIPPLLAGGGWYEWLYRSLVLLVIACPCALVISTPVTIVASLAAAARNGVLVKGGVYIEAPARLEAIAFDKTGTLTEGRPKVVEVVPLNDFTVAQLLERAAAMEARSEHPLAKAIVAFTQARGVPVRPAKDFQIMQGKGATGRFDGEQYWLGSPRYMRERGQESEEIRQQLEAISGAGRTVAVIWNERQVCGFLALADAVRPAAPRALRALRGAGIRHLVMLTGDNRSTAQAIAHEAGVDEVHAELLPTDKVRAVEALAAKYGNVAMVGDGVNDAPALGRATVGIAMGAAGSDAAIETADIALMSDDLSKLPWLVQHSRRALLVIRQNIAFALAVKGLFVALTLTGYSSLWIAIVADMGASLLVIFNGLRLLRSMPDSRGVDTFS